MENDINVINLVRKGDVKAFDILVIKYQDRLVYSVFKFCKDLESDNKFFKLFPKHILKILSFINKLYILIK